RARGRDERRIPDRGRGAGGQDRPGRGRALPPRRGPRAPAGHLHRGLVAAHRALHRQPRRQRGARRMSGGPSSTAVVSAAPATDTEIGTAWAEGAADALELAYARWSPLVHGLARRAVGPVDAEDVTQQ